MLRIAVSVSQFSRQFSQNVSGQLGVVLSRRWSVVAVVVR